MAEPTDKPPSLRDRFNSFARRTSDAVGSAGAFIAALLVVIVWGATGPLFGYSDTWQLVINTGTTIVTFIMVFLIQSTQNRDAKAVHLKLDELIRAVRGARNELVDLEELSDEELKALALEFTAMREKACREAKDRHLDFANGRAEESEEDEPCAECAQKEAPAVRPSGHQSEAKAHRRAEVAEAGG